MKKLYLAACALVSMLATSCSNEDYFLEEPQGVTLKATIDEAQTKVGFEENGKFYWSNGDQICIAGKEEPKVALMNITSGQGTGSATFAKPEGGELGNYAVYPYQQYHELAGDVLKFNISTWQSGTIGTDFFDGDAASRANTKAPMWAKIVDGTANFKHLGGVFCIRLSDIPETKCSVVLTADQRLGGLFEVNLTDATPVIKTDNTAAGKITMNLANSDNKKTGVAYIQAPTGEFTNLTITVNGVNEKNQAVEKHKRTYAKVTVNRGDLVVLSDKEPVKGNGADFSKAVMHQIAKPADLAGDNHRWSAFDGKYALLVGTAGSYAMNLEDIKTNKADYTIQLPGGFSGQLANGHAYISAIAVAQEKGSIKIQHVDLNTDATKAEVIYTKSLEEIGYTGTTRFGDNMSMDLDKNGNGYIFLQENFENASVKVIRLTVTNYTTISEPTLLTSTVITGKKNWLHDTVTRIEGTDVFIHSGASCYPQFVDKDLKAIYSHEGWKGELIEYASVRAFNFNDKRYMIGATTGRFKEYAVANLYDISNGNDAIEGFKYLFAHDRTSLFTQEIGPSQGGNAFVNVNYYVEKSAGRDAKLYLFGSSKDAGFFVAEFPAAE